MIECRMRTNIYDARIQTHKIVQKNQNAAKTSRPKALTMHKILARIIQMRNGEEMGLNRQIEAKIWQFGYLAYD